MTPVINPWLFYWMPVINNIKVIVGILLGLAIAALLVALIMFCMELDYGDGDSDLAKFLKKLGRKLVAVIVVTSLIMVFVPNEKTLTKMIVAQNVTYERVETVTDTVEKVYNDIMNLFEKADVDD